MSNGAGDGTSSSLATAPAALESPIPDAGQTPTAAVRSPASGAAPPAWAGAAQNAPAAWVIDGRYRVVATLGSGGMAQVVQAHDEVLQREVAVKVFRPNLTPEAGRRSLLEMSTLANLNHPGIVAAFDAGLESTPSGTISYLVSELVDGPTLAQRIAVAPLDAWEAAELGAQLGAALAYIHERGVVHRDIKPANVLLAVSPSASDPWTAKLADFGIVRVLGGDALTATGFTVGTLAYLSPEQVRGEAAGPPSDIYSLGLVLLEAITGNRTFPGDGVDVALARLDRRPDLPATLNPQWRDLIHAMTADDPAARPTADDVTFAMRQRATADTDPALGDLDRLLAASVRTGDRRKAHALAGPARSRPARRSLRWLLAAACLLAVLVTGYVVRADRTHSTPVTAPSGQPPAPAAAAPTNPSTARRSVAGTTRRAVPGVLPSVTRPSARRPPPRPVATARTSPVRAVATRPASPTPTATRHAKSKKPAPPHGKKSPH